MDELQLGVMRLLGALARPLLFSLNPEAAHELAIRALRTFPLLGAGPNDPRLAISAFGLDFPNPIGLGAGFDKNGEVVDSILRLGLASPRSEPSRPCLKMVIRAGVCFG